MACMQKTAVVIPCYNEAERLDESRFLTYTKQNSSVSFIFVNDCSQDNTLGILKRLCSDNPEQFFLVDLPLNKGKGAAVREGFLKAFAMDFEAIGYWDADLSTPLSTIGEFSRLLDSPEVNIIFGARVKLLNRKINRQACRHYLGRVFATFVSLILGVQVYDTQCGAKLFRNNQILKEVFSLPFMTAWSFDVEILARFILLNKFGRGASIEEVAIEFPLVEWCEVSGSKLKVLDPLKMLLELLGVLWFLYAPGAAQRNANLVNAGSQRA